MNTEEMQAYIKQAIYSESLLTEGSTTQSRLKALELLARIHGLMDEKEESPRELIVRIVEVDKTVAE